MRAYRVRVYTSIVSHENRIKFKLAQILPKSTRVFLSFKVKREITVVNYLRLIISEAALGQLIRSPMSHGRSPPCPEGFSSGFVVYN